MRIECHCAPLTFPDLARSALCAQLLRSQIVKGNAIGSIFYGVGFSTPGVLAEAFTGNDGTGLGRRLLQTGDPYHLTAKVAFMQLGASDGRDNCACSGGVGIANVS